MKCLRALGIMMVLTLSGLVTTSSCAQSSSQEATAQEANQELGLEQAIFAGGCFWCMEGPFEKLKGVKSAVSGFTGGSEENPSYRDVSHGRTGHVEAVLVTYDPKRVTYEKLLSVYWRQIDPTDPGGQFADRGKQYAAAIFVRSKEERKLAEASKRDLEARKIFNKPIVTPIRDAGPFYPASEYHQNYYKKHPRHYKRYRRRSGREPFLRRVWGRKKKRAATEATPSQNKPSEATLREKLTSLQYRVTQEDATEPPFRNEYWDNLREGIYVDIVSGEPLFSSKDKFKSGTGWPSFTRPLEPEHIVTKVDHSLLMARIEVRSRDADSHLGHVFKDGPEPTGLRYCINSAALKFIPKQELSESPYAKYAELFD